MRRVVSLGLALAITIGGAMLMVYLLLFWDSSKDIALMAAAGFVTLMGALSFYWDLRRASRTGEL